MVIERCLEDREHAGEPLAVRHSEASPGLGGLPLVYCVQLSLTQLLAFELDIGILRCPEILHPCRRREGRERGSSGCTADFADESCVFAGVECDGFHRAGVMLDFKLDLMGSRSNTILTALSLPDFPDPFAVDQYHPGIELTSPFTGLPPDGDHGCTGDLLLSRGGRQGVVGRGQA